ncbi:MAG: sigma-54 dependent transcriptional regulator [Planctomycetes bacterium]|nr:sigma-54 dependent transcriptional regulator [Planctomycetota bacterium]
MSPEAPRSLPRVKVLVVDDEEGHAEAMAETLSSLGSEVSFATTGAEGLRRIAEEDPDLVLTDLVLGDASGMDVLRAARAGRPDREVIVISGRGGIESAVEAMKAGAATYLRKPLRVEEVREVVRKVVEKQALGRTNVELRRRLEERFGFQGIVGTSPAMQRVFEVLRNVASTSATVLILGESGTGKELVAQALHHNSRRASGPFLAINCAALSEGVLESELFGHEKGSFTGAMRTHRGKFEAADGGTLFLDEVGDMPLDLQAKLLRVIEARQLYRVGSNTPVKVDVRLVAATHRDLRALVKEGRFREDLFFRLNVVSIPLPPLRERRDDIPVLATAFLREFRETHGKDVEGFSPAVLDALRAHPWPGNVRELRNAVESMVVVARGRLLDADSLPPGIGPGAPAAPPGPTPATALAGMTLAQAEEVLVRGALEAEAGNRERAARALGISERTLYRKIKEFGLR